MQIRHVNAPDAPAPSGQFTHAVEVTGATRTVYISGQVGTAMDGSVPEDATAQGRLIWHNIQAQLRAVGMTVDNIVKMVTIVTSLDGVTPAVRWSDPYPQGFNRPTGSSAGLGTLLGQGIQFFDRGNYVPYSSQWNFNIQRELPLSTLLEVGYAGSRGIGFQQNRLWNQLPDSALALGDALRQQVPNPFFGQIPVGILSRPTVARAQLLRPFPQYDNVSSQNASWASSTYHALEMKVEKRYASGLSALASYTFSKLMDYGIGPFAGETLGAGAFQNNNNLASDWASSIILETAVTR